jgi:HAD superfamily hydrolase (TIGR01459 family)
MFKLISLTFGIFFSIFCSMIPVSAEHSHISKIEGLESIKDNYDVYLIDVIGVMHDGKNPFKEAVDCVNNLISTEKVIIFISNNPRPGALTREKLLSFGLKQPFEIVTSGDVAREFLSTEFKNKKIYHLGAERNTDITHNLNLKTVENLEQADFVLLTAFLEPEESLAQHTPILNKILRLNLPVLCANPDKVAMHGDKTRLCAGTLAEYLSSRGGNIMYTGKPDKIIFESLVNLFPHIKFDKKKMIMIGDSLETDIKGAHQFGIDSLLVLSGNTGKDLEKEKKDLPSYLQTYSPSMVPSFYMVHLTW